VVNRAEPQSADPTQVARTVYLFRGLDPHAPEPAPPLHPSESQPPAITSARVKPGSSVQLTFSSGDEVELVLGHSTAQDVLADLGAPESRWHRDDQRLGIHFGPHEADEPSHDTDGEHCVRVSLAPRLTPGSSQRQAYSITTRRSALMCSSSARRIRTLLSSPRSCFTRTAQGPLCSDATSVCHGASPLHPISQR
jgi:hypothetical protein